MKKEEKDLFKSLCSFRNDSFDESLLKYATPEVLGHLFFNRMHSIAYGNLMKRGLLNRVNREFRNSLKEGYDACYEKNIYYHQCVDYVEKILRSCNCKFAFLKGACLYRLYPDGFRTANDLDILVAPNDVSKISRALLNVGFVQGFIKNDVLMPANRREIIESKMTRGETVPFIKKVDYPHLKYFEIDINFSLDYKNSEPILLKQMLEKVQNVSIRGVGIPTLSEQDFFIHLCTHLYKEAASMPWVIMNRDMTLYKYCDIYLLLTDMTKRQIDKMFERAVSMNLEKNCAFAILQTAQLFNLTNLYAVEIASEVLKDDPEFIHSVISPSNGKLYIYHEKDISERFFNCNRINLLREVTSYDSP